MKKFYRITKIGRGFSHDYFAQMPKGKRMRLGHWKSQLEEWGESVGGGANYGYRIYVRPCKRRKILKRRQNMKFRKVWLVND